MYSFSNSFGCTCLFSKFEFSSNNCFPPPIPGNAQPYVASTTIHAIDGFTSPIWGVQNGAMQLFSTLLQRMLGQKKTKDDHLNTMTLQEFFVHYPALKPYLLCQLSVAVKSLKETKLHLNPTLYPILTILSKLSAGITQFDALDDLREMVLGLAGSAILAVRELAAAALPALIPKQHVQNYLIHLASLLPESHETCNNYNILHGILLQLYRLFRDVQPENVPNKSLATLSDMIYSRTWIVSESNACFITRAAYIQLIKAIHEKSRIPFTKDLIKILYLELQMIHSRETASSLLSSSSGAKCNVGFDQYLRQLVSWRLEMDTDTVEILTNLLKNENHDLTMACLKHLKLKLCENSSWVVVNDEEWKKIQTLLFQIVLKPDTPWEIQCDAFECLIGIYDVTGTCSYSTSEDVKQDFDRIWEKMNLLLNGERNSRLAGYAVSVMAMLLKSNMLRDDSGNLVRHFCHVLHSCSDPTCADHLRCNCAQALRFVGSELLWFLHKQQQQHQKQHDSNSISYDLYLVKLIESTESLLVDENCDIRNTTAQFVSLVTFIVPSGDQDGTSSSVIHPNVALEKLASWTKHCDKLDLLNLVLVSLKSEGTAAEIITRETKVHVDDLFAPEEVNPYREHAVLHVLRTQFEGLRDISLTDDVTAIIEKECKELVHELDAASGLLSNVSASPLNATCNKFVFGTLWSIIQRCKICMRVATGSDTDKTMVESRTMVVTGLRKLTEIHLLHPKLRLQIENIS